MNIGLLMVNATHDFSFASSDTVAGMGWIDEKAFPHKVLGSCVPVKLKGRDPTATALNHLSLRAEKSGGLVIDGRTGRVFQVDRPALRFLTALQAGKPVERLLAGRIQPERSREISEFLASAARYRLLPRELLVQARAQLAKKGTPSEHE
jgi:hypothetical protein